MSKKVPILPPNLMRLLDERMRELWGCVAVVFAMLCAYALWSYSPNDDSLNVVTSTPPSYALKQVCANIADILKQTFGAMSWIFTISIGVLGIKTTQSNVLTLRRFFEVFIGTSLLCISVQSCFIQQVTASNLMQPIPTGGVIGFLSTRKILELLRSNDLGKMFVACMVTFFLIGLMILKHALGVTIRSISTSIRKITRGIQRVIFRIQTPKPSNEAPTFFKPKDESSPDESEPKPPRQPSRPTRASKDASGYQLPPVELLKLPPDDTSTNTLSKERINEQADKLVEVLSEFGVNGEIMDVQPGPVVTMFEFRPAPGVKTSRIISLSDDIARSMSALSARIANIPGKNAIGIELPNDKRNSVYLRTLLDHAAYRQTNCGLPLILGKNISGAPVVTDLSKMPHLLVAGTTGSGKSVSINTMILSLLYRFTPSECRFIMVDPKMLELFVYNDIPHLLTPVVTEPKKAIFALKWAVREMESRYKAMSLIGVRNIDGFNQKINEGNQKGDVFMRRVQTGFDPETGKPVFEDQPLQYKTFPYIVVVVDEMADLMLVAGKEIEVAVQRLAQMARAAGIHLIMATQRPSVDVITGTIKANFPTRISFQVTSKIDSRTILGEQGAEQLLGHGDMLYMSGGGRILRVHGPFVSDADDEAAASFIKAQGEPEYIDGVTDEIEDGAELVSEGAVQRDDLFNQSVELIRREGRVSISYIQRNFQIGYNKAAKLVEQMEKEGIVSPPDRTGKREIL
ncbi:MAG: DNA translocase FtsK 4TM domain-containing protein [Holosporales bacterium]|jgi:S-DNA-T family DNA segregation ATPase FtsK/SpoIIIE|nr:DNA translocase FtsK 4TM domain-containing protein [Holosporales bacterium]